MDQLIHTSQTFVAEYMKHYDSSHDMSHVSRVCSLAKQIATAERNLEPAAPIYDGNIIALASLLHDVGDKKYLRAGEDGTKAVFEFLLAQGADLTIASKVQDIVNHVSYSSEVMNPDSVAAAIVRFPELAVVQDADRLDALGAVGIGRCFTFNASRNRQSGMSNAIQHFGEKLERLEGMMKTRTGRDMAAERSKRIREFRQWWLEECESV